MKIDFENVMDCVFSKIGENNHNNKRLLDLAKMELDVKTETIMQLREQIEKLTVERDNAIEKLNKKDIDK